jgi:hypothetical protein
MSESLTETRYQTHKVFSTSDFTREEVITGNPLAKAVLQDKQSICKVCGREGDELTENYCSTKPLPEGRL